MTIPNEIIDQIRLSTDIVELIREYVPNLKKAGRNWRALCPFHHEKTPSFMISSEKGIFHCFGCHTGGDAFKFLMQMDNLAWPEAVKKLAHRAGIVIREESDENLISKSEKQKVYDILENAGEFYHRCMVDSEDGSVALRYLKKRGIDETSIKKFCLGYAPRGLLLSAATKKGITLEQLIKAGIVTKTENGKIYEYMSERLVFPIHDAQGRIVAFGGRTLKDEQPKYLNTPETIVYSKSNQLYGLFNAIPKLRQDKKVIVLEGYMDVVMTHQYGVTNTVAALGTALTLQQTYMLLRYVGEITMLFDSDAAGEKAAKKALDVSLDTEPNPGVLKPILDKAKSALEVILNTELTAKVCVLPDGLDPDEYVLKNGKESLQEFIAKQEKPAIEFLIENAMKRIDITSVDDKAKFTAELIPFIKKVKNEVVRHAWIKFVSDKLKISEEAMLQEIKRQQKGGYKDTPEILKKPVTLMRSVEEEILQIIANFSQCRSMVTEEVFQIERNKQVCSFLLQDMHSSEIISRLDEEEARWFTELILEEKNYISPEQTLLNLLKDGKQKKLETERKQLEKEIVLMLDGNMPLDNSKMRLYHELNRQLKGTVK
ncbi:MAG: DNA primase [Elusimicrobia bacterium]|nr:DNA primase [Candidatus Liberimonas magnetica]